MPRSLHGAQRLQLVCRQGSVKVETCTSASAILAGKQPASLLLNDRQQGIQSSKSFPAPSKALSDCVWQSSDLSATAIATCVLDELNKICFPALKTHAVAARFSDLLKLK